MTWTAERTERLTTGWAEGASCGVIAAELGGVTRNAIIGKINRLGLQRRTSLETLHGHQTVKRRPRRPGRDVVGMLLSRAASAGKVKLPETKVPIEPVDHRCTLMELTNETCRWPIGDGPGVLFCGSPSADLASHIPYCGFHSRFAYREYHR